MHVFARSLLFYKAFMQKLFQSSVSEMSQVDDGKAWLKGLAKGDPNAADPRIVPGPYFDPYKRYLKCDRICRLIGFACVA